MDLSPEDYISAYEGREIPRPAKLPKCDSCWDEMEEEQLVESLDPSLGLICPACKALQLADLEETGCTSQEIAGKPMATETGPSRKKEAA